jgi:site-specific DNA recombinase
MLQAAGGTPRPFDVLLLDDTSRLSRNQGETARVFERFNFIGIRIVAVSQGIDSDSEQADVLMAVHGLVDSLYIKELGKKTYRGLEGRALKGFHTGGRCFGYDNVADETGVRQRINGKEAETVRRIFEMAAEGGSLKAIAKALNRDGIPPARPRAGKRYATWCPTAIREMLRRELYIGRIVWNRSRFVKQPGTNKRVRRERPVSEWRIVEQPELRIVDTALWERVQARLAWTAERYGKWSRPGLQHRASTSPHLLTGFLKCGACGASMVVVTGRGKGHHRYGCPQNYYRGACTNRLKERVDWLEGRLLFDLQRAVLRPEVVDYALEEFQRQLTEALSNLTGQFGRMRQRREEIQRQLRNLVESVATLGHSATLVDAINARERELDEITQRLFASQPVWRCGTGQIGIREARYGYSDESRGRGQECPLCGSGDVEPARRLLANYRAAEIRVRMVAGEGFEPSTFGL